MYDLDGKASKRHQLLFHRFLDLRMRKQDLVRYMVLLVCAESLPKLSLHLVVMCLCRWARNLTVAICFDCLMSGVWSRVEFGRVCLAFSSLLAFVFPSCFATAWSNDVCMAESGRVPKPIKDGPAQSSFVFPLSFPSQCCK